MEVTALSAIEAALKRLGIDVKSLKDPKAELLANPAVRQAYDARAPEFELARERIAVRTQAGLAQGFTPL